MSGRRRSHSFKRPGSAKGRSTSVRSPKGAGLFEALEATFDGAELDGPFSAETR